MGYLGHCLNGLMVEPPLAFWYVFVVFFIFLGYWVLIFCGFYLICVWWSLINGFEIVGLLIFRYMDLSLWSVSWLSESLICGEKLIALHHTSGEKLHRCRLENQSMCNSANFGKTNPNSSIQILGKIWTNRTMHTPNHNAIR